jgi:ATP/maltotriose-dependent transcriptional regulator MalT
LMKMLSRPEAGERSVLRATALNAAGYIQWFEGHNAEARRLLEEALDIAREVGDQRQIALAVRTLGPVLYGLGEYQAAGLSLEEGLLLAHQLTDDYGIAWSLMFLGDVALQAGNPDQAQRSYRESIDLLTKLEDAAFLAYANRRLGLVVAGYQDYERGKALCRASLELNVAIRDRRAVAASLIGLAGLAIMQGLTIHGTQLLSAAERLLSSIAAHLLVTDQHEYERHLETVRNRLDAPTFDRAWAAGQSMSMDEAVSYGLEEAITLIKAELLERGDKQAPTQPLPDALTTRELEILNLMAQGLSNRDIAESLVLSVGTVKWYGSQICSKLHARNRVQAIARARELKILL